jgi:hypothetical protein
MATACPRTGTVSAKALTPLPVSDASDLNELGLLASPTAMPAAPKPVPTFPIGELSERPQAVEARPDPNWIAASDASPPKATAVAAPATNPFAKQPAICPALLGAIPKTLAANVVVHLSISVTPSSGMWKLLAGARFFHELLDCCKNPNDHAKIRRVDHANC